MVPNSKIVSITPPAAIKDNAAYTTASVDLKGFDYAIVTLWLGATDIAMVAAVLQDSNTDGSFADLTGGDFDGDTMSNAATGALPTALQDNLFFQWRVDAKKVKRFLNLSITAGDGSLGTYAIAFAQLFRANLEPDTLVKRGLIGELIIP